VDVWAFRPPIFPDSPYRLKVEKKMEFRPPRRPHVHGSHLPCLDVRSGRVSVLRSQKPALLLILLRESHEFYDPDFCNIARLCDTRALKKGPGRRGTRVQALASGGPRQRRQEVKCGRDRGRVLGAGELASGG